MKKRKKKKRKKKKRKKSLNTGKKKKKERKRRRKCDDEEEEEIEKTREREQQHLTEMICKYHVNRYYPKIVNAYIQRGESYYKEEEFVYAFTDYEIAFNLCTAYSIAYSNVDLIKILFRIIEILLNIQWFQEFSSFAYILKQAIRLKRMRGVQMEKESKKFAYLISLRNRLLANEECKRMKMEGRLADEKKKSRLRPFQEEVVPTLELYQTYRHYCTGEIRRPSRKSFLKRTDSSTIKRIEIEDDGVPKLEALSGFKRRDDEEEEEGEMKSVNQEEEEERKERKGEDWNTNYDNLDKGIWSNRYFESERTEHVKIAIAKQIIYRGTQIIAAEQPLLFYCEDDTHCYYCAKRCEEEKEKFKICAQCGAIFCSTECHERAWSSFHRFECKLMKKNMSMVSQSAFADFPDDLGSFTRLFLRFFGQAKMHSKYPFDPMLLIPYHHFPYGGVNLRKTLNLSNARNVYEVYVSFKNIVTMSGCDCYKHPYFDFQTYVKFISMMQYNCIKENEKRIGLFFKTSMFGHSCVPNALQILLPSGFSTVVASKHIALGEKITLSYLNVKTLWKERQNYLFRRYNHATCDCKKCAADAEEDAKKSKKKWEKWKSKKKEEEEK
ncbi:MAG: SET domain-containing protein [Promethearchaeota archaeon]